MSAKKLDFDKVDYDKIVKDHISMRLMESGWTDQLERILKSAVSKRVAEGQAPKNIKFEQLFNDAFDKARDAVPNELDVELHEKMGEYLAVKNGTSGEDSSSCIPSPFTPGGLSEASDTLENPSNIVPIISSKVASCNLSETTSNIPSEDSTNVPSEILSNVPFEICSDVAFEIPSNVPFETNNFFVNSSNDPSETSASLSFETMLTENE